MERHERLQEQRLKELESLALLGKLSTGIAHELNNAVSVIASGSYWLGGIASEILADHFDEHERSLFLHGLENGRPGALSEDVSKIVQRDTERIIDDSNLSYSDARNIARMQLPIEMSERIMSLKDPMLVVKSWEIGATLHDLKVASHQATHVVDSMRELGARPTDEYREIDICKTLTSAVAILQNFTKGLELTVDSPDEIIYKGLPGEFVQIWVNIIQNACDAIASGDHPENGKIFVFASEEEAEVIVRITNNGPKIPDGLRPQIFDPDVSTKRLGLSFGLGIGLTLVKGIVSRYNGRIDVESDDEDTAFTIRLPKEFNETQVMKESGNG